MILSIKIDYRVKTKIKKYIDVCNSADSLQVCANFNLLLTTVCTCKIKENWLRQLQSNAAGEKSVPGIK